MDQGRTERLLADLAEEVRERFYGKYRGRVTDNADPRGMGRLKARVPEVLGDRETPWAVPCAPFAGDGSGQFCLPPLDAGVWIEFEAGDPSRPLWSGGWWGEGEAPTNEAGSGGRPEVRVIRSEEGLLVSMDDDAGTISVSDANGDNLLKIEVHRGEVSLKGRVKVVVDAPQVELVENGTHPVVLGDELLNYLNQLVNIYQTHIHPGQMAGPVPVTPAPPVPPVPMPAPNLLSVKVKSG